jgi:hypothetical protein
LWNYAASKFYNVDVIGGGTTSSQKGLILPLPQLVKQMKKRNCVQVVQEESLGY